MKLLYMFPGVPIFFFVSGFLISKSYESNASLMRYLRNRVLRIFPGLIACVALSIVAVILSGYLVGKKVSWLDLMLLFLAKVTIVQFYNPEFLREYGDGVLNGSLWTITVEMQFYLLTPICCAAFQRYKSVSPNVLLASLILMFLVFNRIYSVMPELVDDNILVTKVAMVSFVPWFYMFLLGVLAQKNFSLIHPILAGKGWILVLMYICMAAIAETVGIALGNNINPLVGLMLCTTVFSCAYSAPRFSEQILRRNDISYGLYLYHMPIVNGLIFAGLHSATKYGLLALVVSVSVAVFSWVLVERPFLGRKQNA